MKGKLWEKSSNEISGIRLTDWVIDSSGVNWEEGEEGGDSVWR